MEPALKFVLLLFVLTTMGTGGVRLYRYLNKKIMESETGWSLFFYTLLLFVSLGVLCSGGLYLLINVYVFLSHNLV